MSITESETQAKAASVPEPDVWTVVGFTNVSPSDGVERGYVAVRDPKGWRTTSSSGRIPSRSSWETIQSAALREDGVSTLQVFGTLAFKGDGKTLEAPSSVDYDGSGAYDEDDD